MPIPLHTARHGHVGCSLEDVQPFQHVLVAVDFGSSSLRAVVLAAELAKQMGARLTILHVLHDAPALFPVEVPAVLPVDGPEHRERAAKRELDAFLRTLADRVPACSGAVRFGDPARQIVAHAEETGCDLVVVGTHGRGRIARWLLGSVAEKVVRTSRVPVLTVRAEAMSATSTVGTATALR